MKIKYKQWACGEMVDTLVLGTSAFGMRVRVSPGPP